MNFEERLDRTLSQIEPQRPFPNNFYHTYTFPTENVYEYLQYFDLKDKKLLTVGSSGSQLLNSFFLGARDMTLLDINENAEYYIWLVISSIISLNYYEYQKFFFIHCYDIEEDYYNKARFNKGIFNNKIKPILRLFNYEAYLYYDELFSNYETQRIVDYLMDDDEYRPAAIKGFNIYLKNEENYEKLKKEIHNINFQFLNGDIFEIDIPDKYDNIFLSNLCTYVKRNKLKKLLEKLDKNNLNTNGKILFAYLFNTDYNNKEYGPDWQEIYYLDDTKKEFQYYLSEYHQITSARNFVHHENKKEDLVLIYRKDK